MSSFFLSVLSQRGHFCRRRVVSSSSATDVPTELQLVLRVTRVISHPSPGPLGTRLRGCHAEGGVSANETATELVLFPLSPLSTLAGCGHPLSFDKSEVGNNSVPISVKDLYSGLS